MSTEKRYLITADTGISGTIKSGRDLLCASQDELRRCLSDYGDFIYGAGGAPVQWERRNHWEPKLMAAKKFTVSIKD